MSQLRQLSTFSSPEPAARFDLMNLQFRQHVVRLTGLIFCPAVDGSWDSIEWWNTATESDARRSVCIDGSIKDFSRVWKRQTLKLQLVWDAWTAGRKLLLNEIQNILEKEFGY